VFRLLPSIAAALLLLVLGAGAALADLAKLDPRARAALGLLRGGTTAEARKRAGAATHGEDRIDAFVVGPVSRVELEAAGAVVRTDLPGILTAYIPASAVEAVAGLAGVQRIQGAAPVELELDASLPTTGAHLLRGPAPGFPGLAGQGVLVGDVDSGVDFDHPDFKDAGGLTRLVGIWDQNDPAGPGPAPFGYGTEWSAAQIDGGLCTQTDSSGHGTHVLAIAGGDGSGTGGTVPAHTYVGIAPAADLIMVNTNFQTTAIVDGVAWIFDRATALGVPAVVNLSLGSHFGPHDGTSAFEAGLSALTGPGRIIVKSAGNERGQARHAEVFAAGAGTNATLSVTGGNVAGRAFAVDGYYEASENLAVQVTTPGGTILGPVPLGGIHAAYPGTSTVNGSVYLENGASLTATGDREVYLEVNVGAGQSANGTWTLRFLPVALGAANGEVDLWRFFNTTASASFVTGNQPTEELVSEPGNAAELITTAAYSSKRTWTDCNGLVRSFTGAPAVGALAPFSSPGPTRDGRPKPDLAAPGTAIGSATTFDVPPSCAPAGSLNLPDGMRHTINQGTSMAAPHATGAAALVLQKHGAVTPAFVKALLHGRAVRDAFTGPAWNRDWGHGKLFLGDLVDPAALVLTPNGGELYLIGQAVNLAWNAGDALGGVTGVDLELSRSGPGGPWETIALAQPNTGSYPWVASGTPTTQAILRVTASDAAGNTGSDVSDQVWTIEASVPAILAACEAASVEGGVEIRWQLGDRAAQGARVRIERADLAAGPYAGIAAERRSEGDVEIALDRTAEPGHTYFYRLVLDDATFGPIAVRTGALTTAFALAGIAPNPSSAGPVDIAFTVAREARVSLAVYDLRGRRIARLVDREFTPGRHSTRWDGTIDGARAPAGLYFVRFVSPAGERSARIVLSN
jgi:subtilisin family serine protease